jgi:hypothetical protein
MRIRNLFHDHFNLFLITFLILSWSRPSQYFLREEKSVRFLVLACYFLVLLLDHENGGNASLRNVGKLLAFEIAISESIYANLKVLERQVH